MQAICSVFKIKPKTTDGHLIKTKNREHMSCFVFLLTITSFGIWGLSCLKKKKKHCNVTILLNSKHEKLKNGTALLKCQPVRRLRCYHLQRWEAEMDTWNEGRRTERRKNVWTFWEDAKIKAQHVGKDLTSVFIWNNPPNLFSCWDTSYLKRGVI